MCSKKMDTADIIAKLNLCNGDGEWGDAGAEKECDFSKLLKPQLAENIDAAWLLLDSFIIKLGMGFAFPGSLDVGIGGWRYRYVYNFLFDERSKVKDDRRPRCTSRFSGHTIGESPLLHFECRS